MPGWNDLSPDDSRLAEIVGTNGSIQIRDANNKRILITLTGCHPYRRVVFSPDGCKLAAFTSSGIELYDADARVQHWNDK